MMNKYVWKSMIQVADKTRIPWRQDKSDGDVLVENTLRPFSNAEKHTRIFFILVMLVGFFLYEFQPL